MTCKHENFAAKVSVAHLEDTGGFMAEITIKCSQCDLPFQFLRLEPGLDMQGARVSIESPDGNSKGFWEIIWPEFLQQIGGRT